MYVSRLQLTNFRNYRHLDLHLPPGAVFLFGDNAQGKTNLLEAIYLLATTRSPRAESDAELINRRAVAEGEAVARLVAEGERRDGSVKVEMAIALDAAVGGRITSKRLRVNGVPRRAADLVGQIGAVLFSAQDIDIITGPPLLRRRYLDILLYQVDRSYLAARQHYTRVLAQRNHLLRRIKDGHAQAAELAFWDGELAKYGSQIMQARARAVAELAQETATAHHALSAGREMLSLVYRPHLDEEPLQDIAALSQGDLAARFNERLKGSLNRELAAGATVIGPHRDDVQILLDGEPASAYASRGQQRTAALSLRLAEARYLHVHSDEEPVLLLDDVLSELDSRRRSQIMAMAGQYQQVIMTATEPDVIGCMPPGATCFRVTGGRVEPWDDSYHSQ